MLAQPPKHLLLLMNRSARRGREGLGLVIDLLERQGIQVLFRSTRNPEDINQFILDNRDHVDAVAIGGGDGTLNAALPALLESQLPLGILPLGTANDLARTLGIAPDLSAACQTIAEGYVRRIDVGQANDRFFFNVASLGLSVKITERLSGPIKRRWGILAYAWSALRAIGRSRPFSATISANGQEYHVKTLQIAVGNGRYYGGGMSIAWDARIDDHRLDLYSLEIAHWWQILPLLPALRAGRYASQRPVRSLAAAEIWITTTRSRHVNIDGELATTTPVHVRVIPAAIDVYVPNTPSLNTVSIAAFRQAWQQAIF